MYIIFLDLQEARCSTQMYFFWNTVSKSTENYVQILKVLKTIKCFTN